MVYVRVTLRTKLTIIAHNSDINSITIIHVTHVYVVYTNPIHTWLIYDNQFP